MTNAKILPYCLLKKHNIFTPKLVPVREDLCFKIFMNTNTVVNNHNQKKYIMSFDKLKAKSMIAVFLILGCCVPYCQLVFNSRNKISIHTYDHCVASVYSWIV